MRITYKYRLQPTPAQRTALQGILDGCRWVYNKTLAVRRDTWQERQESLSRYDTNKLLTQWRTEHEFLASGHAQAMQEAQRRVDLAFRAFFRRVKAGEEPGYPRFRGYHRYDSFTYPQAKGNWRFLLNGRLRLSKVGDVKIKLHRSLTGKCKTLTIRRDAVGNWYACFSCEVDAAPRGYPPLPPTDKVVGVDLGLTTFAALSNGEQIARQRWMKRDEQDIARLQRKKERFAKGTPERRKVVHALCHAYERAAHRRRNFAHQQSRKLVNQYQFIVFEDLDIQQMQGSGTKTIRRGVADVAWGQFVSFITYKAAWASRGVVRVNPKGTTQMCSGCGAIVPKDLSVRTHECPECGLKIGRDVNAALNILARGLSSLNPGGCPLGAGVVEAP
jgi:putative transposase